MNNERNNNEIIRNFLSNGRQEGLLESLLLVGTNMIINDISVNNISGNNLSENNISNSNYRNWYYNSTSNLDNTNYLLNNIINRSFHEKPTYKKVISEKGLLELEERKFNQTDKNHSCPIYQNNFTNESDIIKLPCNHIFTPEAIKKWLKEENAICPVCRYELDSIMVKNNQNEEETNINTNIIHGLPNINFVSTYTSEIINENHNINDEIMEEDYSDEGHEEQIYPELYNQNENENEIQNENENENENENQFNYEYHYINEDNDENEDNENEEIQNLIPSQSTFYDYVMELFHREEERLQLEEQAIQQTILNSLEENNTN